MIPLLLAMFALLIDTHAVHNSIVWVTSRGRKALEDARHPSVSGRVARVAVGVMLAAAGAAVGAPTAGGWDASVAARPHTIRGRDT